MNSNPQVTDSYFTEQDGIIQVRTALNKMKLIFRETPNADVGIDGQIEFAVQIKSGNSHVHDKGDHFAYYAEQKHRNYWAAFPLPVILIIHVPSHGNTFFVDARHVLNIPNYILKYIAIPKSNILNESSKENLFESLGRVDEPFLSIPDVLSRMAVTCNNNPTFFLSYLGLFSFGLTNISRHVFYSMSLAMDLAEWSNETELGMSVGEREHNFLHSYVAFLISQNLARVDYADYLIDWKEQLLMPMFIAPLTNRGRQLLDEISKNENQYFGNTILTRERLIRNEIDFSDDARLVRANELTRKLIS